MAKKPQAAKAYAVASQRYLLAALILALLLAGLAGFGGWCLARRQAALLLLRRQNQMVVAALQAALQETQKTAAQAAARAAATKALLPLGQYLHAVLSAKPALAWLAIGRASGELAHFSRAPKNQFHLKQVSWLASKIPGQPQVKRQVFNHAGEIIRQEEFSFAKAMWLGKNAAGEIISRQPEEKPQKIDPRQQSWFKEVNRLADGESVYLAKAPENGVLTLACPLPAIGGQLGGVLAVGWRMAAFPSATLNAPGNYAVLPQIWPPLRDTPQKQAPPVFLPATKKLGAAGWQSFAKLPPPAAEALAHLSLTSQTPVFFQAGRQNFSAIAQILPMPALPRRWTVVTWQPLAFGSAFGVKLFGAAGLALLLPLFWLLRRARVAAAQFAVEQNKLVAGLKDFLALQAPAAEDLPAGFAETGRLAQVLRQSQADWEFYARAFPAPAVAALRAKTANITLKPVEKRLAIMRGRLQPESGAVLNAALGAAWQNAAVRQIVEATPPTGAIWRFNATGWELFYETPLTTSPEAKAVLLCQAALACQKVAGQLKPPFGAAAPWRVTFGLDAKIAATGGCPGGAGFDYGIIGAGARRAAVLAVLGKFYGINLLASGELQMAAGDEFVWRAVDYVLIDQEAELIFELLGLRAEAAPEVLHWVRENEKALGAYRAGDFALAQTLYAGIAAQRGNDPVAQEFMRRCQNNLLGELPPDWDGAQRFMEVALLEF